MSTLAPISRRTALATSLAAILPWPKALQASSKSIPQFSFIVVSDTHLGRAGKDDAAKQWKQTAAEIQTAKGDFVLHLGDIVDGRREAQYPVYLETRHTIKKPLYEIPGNHDTHELFAKHIRKNVDMAFDHQGVRFLLINNSRPDSVNGFISKEQINWLGEQCDEAAAKKLFVILCMHVPAHVNKPPDAGAYVKLGQGHDELYALLKRHEKIVLALFHGHFHCGLHGWDDHAPLQEVVFPSALYNIDNKLTEKNAPGYTLPEFRPGFTLVEISKSGLILRYKPVGTEATQDKTCELLQFK
ncbi:MAG: metallophosphoesterase [Gemmatales bacterium]